MIHDRVKSSYAHEFSDTIDQAWDTILERQVDGYACFYFLNEVAEGVTYAHDYDVLRVRAIPADFDHGIPTEWHTLPDLLVHTSPGRGQALWKVTQDFPLKEFKPVCRRIIAKYGSDPAVCNLSRILRLPGTNHLKAEPKLVTFERLR
jgi:hypothetical protein